MKKLILIALLAFLGIEVSHAQTAPYKAAYSSNFKIADASYSNKVLTLWKDYENNTLDNHLEWFADTVSMTLADGRTVKGKAENLAGVKAFRGSLKDMKVTIDAFVSLKSVDHNENVVCVWGEEQYTDANGKAVKVSIQEVWGFNRDGKIAMMLQYAQGGGGM
ncbi:nuclear transport factor 2 family protein [Mucilaginibacter ginsenosidivorans]|uniref:Nuclear transport factor 2 family protein n=1 Tax=Mucilaginibacter ginsenosidivorans TaxID=398053 RepID=A0A5B8UZB1_9SPHI|nr:nuclear transport factor 2 family protein [Mucilaginibacter ginsenosidivorans]QEC64547.1 nuclear transport factor 2 family protein [Mucilaginibacter ginsenosidivorans]